MCGIVSIVDSTEQVLPSQIDAMRALIAHRGPDGGGTFVRHTQRFSVGLGAQRLSILDLSPAGMMPMSNEKESIWIAYNGEIYNHLELRATLEHRGYHYRSRTDTETVLHAYEEYGPECFALFNGMFACVIYDEANQRVVVARDRTGIKPLYYTEGRGQVAFASELKALVHTGIISAEIDPLGMDIYLALGYIPAPHSLIKDVRKLSAGTYGIYEDGLFRTERYWSPSFTSHPSSPRTWNETVEATRITITDAVHRQMMSDVPVGVMLSGGLDSSIIAAIAQQTSSDLLHTFSIGFETAQVDLEPIYNFDRDNARQVAKALGTQHHEIIASDSLDLGQQIRQLVAQLDEPVWEPSFLSIYLISTLARANGVKVLLSGDGSDELFGGYPWHPAVARLEQIERVPGLRPLLAVLARLPLPNTTAAKVLDLQRKYRASDISKYHAQYDVFDATTRAALFGRSEASDPLDALIKALFAGNDSVSLTTRFAFGELVLWVGEHFNQRLDRMTMAASVEGRVPFQDNAVTNLALMMPYTDKLRGGSGKAPLRAAFATQVPSFVIQRPKRPFAAPATAWMNGTLRPLILDLLSRESLARLPGIDPNIGSLIQKRLREGLPVRQEQVWSLTNLVLWAEALWYPVIKPSTV